eukprot:5031050-Amphidinium_carterae.1
MQGLEAVVGHSPTMLAEAVLFHVSPKRKAARARVLFISLRKGTLQILLLDIRKHSHAGCWSSIGP